MLLESISGHFNKPEYTMTGADPGIFLTEA